jgi:hypothetical protein
VKEIIMTNMIKAIEAHLVRIAKEAEATLSEYAPINGDRLLCRIKWATKGFEPINVVGGPIERMARVSSHCELQTHAFEQARMNDIKQLAQDLRSLSGGTQMTDLAIEVYAPSSRGRTRMMAEINSFELSSKKQGPRTIAKALHAELTQ